MEHFGQDNAIIVQAISGFSSKIYFMLYVSGVACMRETVSY